jgi:hypothetical protein
MPVKIADAITRTKATLEAFRCMSNADQVLRIHCVTFGDLRAIVEAAERGPTAAERAAVDVVCGAAGYREEHTADRTYAAKIRGAIDVVRRMALDALCGKGAK